MSEMMKTVVLFALIVVMFIFVGMMGSGHEMYGG